MLISVCLNRISLASTILSTEWTPTKSRQGEPIRFTIKVKTRSADLIRNPEFPSVLSDWDLIRSIASPRMRTIVENGSFTTIQENEYSYILAPRKKGLLTVPSVVVPVGAKRFRTEEKKIQVDNIPLGANSWDDPSAPPTPMPAPKAPSFPDPNSPWGPGVPGMPRDEDLLEPFSNIPQTQNDTYDFKIPGDGRQTFFLKAHISKTNVFLGEMIEVSFRAYTKSMNLREPEITKFPEFKGFLKEDLYFPKVFDPRPVLIQGQSFFETELIRYALYPIKEGSLSIDAMTFKLRISTFDSLADSILNGTPFDGRVGTLIPMEKTSGSTPVIVKPLPIPKPDSFTGAVGQYAVQAQAVPASAQSNQPFSWSIAIEGVGNLKAIEAPKLTLPKEIEITNIATHPGVLEKDGSGNIKFEYLLTPTQAGNITIPESEWSYFDPSKIEYVRLKIPGGTINVTQGSSLNNIAEGSSKEAPKVLEWMSKLSESKKTVQKSQIGEPSFIGGHLIFGIHLTGLSLLLGAAWRKRKSVENEIYIKENPWTVIENELKSHSKMNAKQLAEKIDLFTRLKIIGAIKTAGIKSSIHAESPRSELSQLLKEHLIGEHSNVVLELKNLWDELDNLRFSGAKSSNTDSEVKPYFEKAKALANQISKNLKIPIKKSYQGFQDEWSGGNED